jgi:putative heme-binding domain-containing protein
MQPRLFLLLLPLLGNGQQLHADISPLGLRVPPGFEVTEYADNTLAPNIHCMTLDPQGRVVVSGPGYIKILVDEQNTGRATRALVFADGPKDGAQGLFWEDSWLYCTGDGGLRRFRVARGADRADGPSELIRSLKTGGEHEAHAIRRGPDGWLYLLCGNSTRIDKTYAQLPTSPIADPVAGCVLRFTPDLKSSEIVADGFRNPYGMDFTVDGELVTFDSDNERCVSLPWYEATRFYHVIPGGHYGWQNPQHAETWRWPPYFADVVAPVAYLGRGSPTGVACYRHVQFPEHYQGGVFLLDWTFGKVWFLTLKRSGSTYTCQKEVFLESVGDNGFAPTAVAVQPVSGDLFISIGGRGTRGAVYRIRYPARAGIKDAGALARLQIKPRSLDWRPEMNDKLNPERARLGMDGAKLSLEKAHLGTLGIDFAVRMRALTYIYRHRAHFDADEISQIVQANWDVPDRYVRQQAARLLATLPAAERRKVGLRARTPLQQLTYGLGSLPYDREYALRHAAALVGTKDLDVNIRLGAVRLMQLALGDLIEPKLKTTVWAGYSLRTPDILPDSERVAAMTCALRAAFPTGHADLDREITRTLAAIEDDDPGVLGKVAERLTTSSDPVEDIHYLIVLARLRGARSPELTRKTAGALLALDRKIGQRRLNRDRNWPLRVGEMYAELARKDAALHAALLAHPDFGRPDHALFARCPGFDRRAAAERFLAQSKKDPVYAWNADLVDLIGNLPDEQGTQVLRQLWGQAGMDEAILPVLARHPGPADRDKFLEGLQSPRLAIIRACLDALEKLPSQSDGACLLALVRCLRCLADGREETQVRHRLARYLQQVTGQTRFGTDKQAWTDWFARTYPELAARLGNADGVDVVGWSKRLAHIDWSIGVPERGAGVFVKANCSSCHSGALALGPDLRGVATRFSRDDLMTAIIQPSKDISPRYRTLLIATENGKVYQGLVIYEAVDSLILQTGPAATVRIPVDQINTRRFTDTSLMPPGLLDRLSDREIADLVAYLKKGLTR